MNREKKIIRRYLGIKVSEVDLISLSKLIDTVNVENKLKFSIEIISHDREDVITSDNYDIFKSDDVPTKIDSIKISFLANNLVCQLDFSPEHFKPVELIIYGTEIDAANSLFRELDRKLNDMKYQDILWLRYLDKFWYSLILGLITGSVLGFGVYSLFDFLLNVSSVFIDDFENSSFRKSASKFGWNIVFVSIGIGSVYIIKRLKRVFPLVRFTGKFRGAYYQRRKNLLFFVVIVIIPIIVNLISNLIWSSHT